MSTDLNTIDMKNTVAVESRNENVGSSRCCKKFTDVIIGALENTFAKIGYIISQHPIKSIIICIVVSLLCVFGVMEMYSENRGEKLWVATDSKSLEYQRWVKREFPSKSRFVVVLVEKDNNILSPEGLSALCDIDIQVKMLYNGTDLEWSKICLSLDKAGKICKPSTILQLWNYNYTLIKSLNQSAILQDINRPNLTSTNGAPIDLNLLLGSRRYDQNNKLVFAKATKMTYFLKNQAVFVKSEGKEIDTKGEKWETEFTKVMAVKQSGIKKWTYSITSFKDDGGSTIRGDLPLLFVGYVLIIIYLAVMLGSFSRIDHKAWLAVCGVVCIGLAIGIAYGLSSAFQLPVTPVHNILPFLLLGIGVDDVFVIIQNWDNIGGPQNHGAISTDISKAMRHAGVSILVTSFTDVCAFLIGATTVLPALRSFCIFAAIGVLAVFMLTCTHFVAWLSLDSKRQRNNRDACCCIVLDSNWQAMECSKRKNLQYMANIYSKFLLSNGGRVCVFLVTIILLAVASYGLSLLKQDFNPDWFLPPHSKSVQYNKAVDQYFSDEGVQSTVYIGQVDYFAEQNKIADVYKKIKNNKYVLSSSVKSWYFQYINWMKLTNRNLLDADFRVKTENDFYSKLNEFLKTKQGSLFFADIQRHTDVKGSIKASRIKFTHKMLLGATEQIKAMDSLQDAVKSVKFNNFEVFSYTRIYIQWETDKVISTELIRNLLLAGIIVFAVTLFLIANVWVSLMVVSCIVFTLIDIAGFMHFWGLTVDTITTIQLILAIGLSVDYSAHIGHGFMASRKGSRIERTSKALTEIGPAVVHGGFSTFLAFVCLSGSQSYVFKTFFKLFFMVVIFGLFHGLAYLPVLLSLVGPKAYASTHNEDEIEDKHAEQGIDKSITHQTVADVQLKKYDHVGSPKSNGSCNQTFASVDTAQHESNSGTVQHTNSNGLHYAGSI